MEYEYKQLPLIIQPPCDETFSSFISFGQDDILSSLQHALNSEYGGYIYLWGANGTGKSHLLHSAISWCESCLQSSCYIPLQYIEQLKPEMLSDLENMHLICLDNLEFIADKPEWELAVFNLFNRIKAKGKLLLITSNTSARNLNIQLPDLKSRLDWGLNYQLQKHSDNEKLAILQLRANLRGLVLSDDSGKFLLNRASRNISELCQMLSQLDLASMSAQRKLTIPFIKQTLGF